MPDKRNRPAKVYYLNEKKSPNGIRKWGAIPRVRILPHLSNFNDGPVLAEIKGELSNYYVSIEFDKNGKIWFKSGQATDKSSARNIIKIKNRGRVRLPPYA